MTNESNSTTTALPLRCVTAVYPLSTNHHPLRGLKCLPVKRLPISHYGSRTCRDEFRNPMIIKNVMKGKRGLSLATETCWSCPSNGRAGNFRPEVSHADS